MILDLGVMALLPDESSHSVVWICFFSEARETFSKFSSWMTLSLRTFYAEAYLVLLGVFFIILLRESFSPSSRDSVDESLFFEVNLAADGRMKLFCLVSGMMKLLMDFVSLRALFKSWSEVFCSW